MAVATSLHDSLARGDKHSVLQLRTAVRAPLFVHGQALAATRGQDGWLPRDPKDLLADRLETLAESPPRILHYFRLNWSRDAKARILKVTATRDPAAPALAWFRDVRADPDLVRQVRDRGQDPVPGLTSFVDRYFSTLRIWSSSTSVWEVAGHRKDDAGIRARMALASADGEGGRPDRRARMGSKARDALVDLGMGG